MKIVKKKTKTTLAIANIYNKKIKSTICCLIALNVFVMHNIAFVEWDIIL